MVFRSLMFILAVVMAGDLPAQENVRMELARQQQQTGLALTSFYRNLYIVKFADRSSETKEIPIVNESASDGTVSRDGNEIAMRLSATDPMRFYLGIVHSDGTALRRYPDVVAPDFLSWSHDKSKLAARVSRKRGNTASSGPQLVIIDTSSGAIREFDASGYLTSQSWSPDGEEIVYGVDDTIRIYNLKQDKWRELVRGKEPTWSSDGNWIAFVDHDSYYIIRPTGGERKLLFKSKYHTRGALWWSPDSRIVAYLCLSDHWFNHTGFVARQLRVRRLADNSDDWLSEGGDVGYVPSFQWVLPKQPPKSL